MLPKISAPFIWRDVRYFLITAIISVSIFSLIGCLAIMAARNQNVIRRNITEDIADVFAAKSSGDIHTECLVISGAVSPDNRRLRYILDPKMLVSSDPCVGLRTALSSDESIDWVSYSRYWMGSTFLGLIALRFLTLSHIHELYSALLSISILSLSVMGLTGLRKDLRLPLALACLGIYEGIGIEKFGGHPGHSPVYFLCFFALSAFLTIRFSAIGRREACIIGCVLGNIVGYYDILSGAIPFTAALSIFVYYLLWKGRGRPESSHRDFWIYVFILMANYIGSIITVMLLKLFIFLFLLHRPDAIIDFFNELTLRMSGNGVPEIFGFSAPYVLRRLWWNSKSVYIGGQISANITFVIGGLSWLFAGALCLKRFIQIRDIGIAMDFFVNLIASLTIIGWFLVFKNHGYAHAWFMTRIICIIPALGIVTALMVGYAKERPKTLPA